MEAKRYIGKVLDDGHLTLPEEAAKEVGKVYEVILFPSEESGVYTFAEQIVREKGFAHYSEKDIERIIHESRRVKE